MNINLINFVKLKRANLENSTDSTNIQNTLNAIKTKNMFVVHKYDGNGIYSNIDNNNEVKVFKNHKVVYVNTSLLNSYHFSKNLLLLKYQKEAVNIGVYLRMEINGKF